MKNWQTNLGGAVSVLGTTLIGVGVLGMTNPKYQDVLWWVALVGFIISALGKGLTALFAADASTVNNIAKAVDEINRGGSNADAATVAKPADAPKLPVWLLIAALSIGFVGLESGCTTPQQRVAFNTIGSAESVASAAVDGYYTAVIKGVASTNDVPKVSQAFNQFQAAATLAAALDQAGTNAVAPAQLNAELAQLLSLVSTLVPTK